MNSYFISLKVHILKGLFGANKNFEKIARFCGPRKNFEPLPWDGKRRIYHNEGDMDFWDRPYDIKSNKVRQSTIFIKQIL